LTVPINVKVSSAIAEKLHRRSLPEEDLTEIFDIERDFGIAIKPLHPNTKDPSLNTHFIIELLDETKAKEVIDRLLRTKFVDAAYIKPQDEPP